MASPSERPRTVELLEPRFLLIEWEDGHESLYPHRLLREICECAGCVDEWTRRPILDPAKLPANLRVTGWEGTGHYGMNLRFSDGHATGIYSFRSLRAACPCPECEGARSGAGSEAPEG